MATRNRHGLWNFMIGITLILCTLAFVAHYKNWIKTEPDQLRVFSGIYRKVIPYAEIDSVAMVKRLPLLSRMHGFSAWEKLKGVYIDSLSGREKVYVFVDNISQPKIRMVYRDSLQLFLNYPDSTETHKFLTFLQEQLKRTNTTSPQ